VELIIRNVSFPPAERQGQPQRKEKNRGSQTNKRNCSKPKVERGVFGIDQNSERPDRNTFLREQMASQKVYFGWREGVWGGGEWGSSPLLVPQLGNKSYAQGQSIRWTTFCYVRARGKGGGEEGKSLVAEAAPTAKPTIRQKQKVVKFPLDGFGIGFWEVIWRHRSV